MRTVSGKLLIGVLCLFIIVSLILYNSLETKNLEQKRSYGGEKTDIEKLEKQILFLEGQVKNNDVLMNNMLRKVLEGRKELKKHEYMSDKNRSKVDKENGADIVEKGFLQMPKKPEQIEKEAKNAAEAAEQKAQEEQAVNGVIHPPQERSEGRKKSKIDRKVSVVRKFLNRVSARPDNVCSAALSMLRPDGNVQMIDMYNVLPFDDPDGGVWKQGFDITYSPNAVKREKRLEVIVVPHSHTDPGWIKTFEQYYETQTRNILDGMLNYLQTLDKMRFVYAEMSFFEKWWAEIDEMKRESVKQLLKSRRLEILTGGWVMTDEANAHYYAVISQLLEGHEWIRNHIGSDYNPKSHWSIDPFGQSPTISYFLKLSNFSNSVIQRVHYSVKKYLAERQQLEFMWRQFWGRTDDATDLMTHMMPFYSYDVPHTCGPDPEICCQFDFKRITSVSCPWKIPAVSITEDNLVRKASALYDQYRKKAQLYKTNVVLVPLGDDFRYDTETEWISQYENYVKLFDYMNAQKNLNVYARFGTVEDYFNLVRERLREDGSKLPILSGDFFTYADRNDHYWSGYYTSRPFFKSLDRVLQHHVRTAEILYSFMNMKGWKEESTPGLFGLLVNARRSMGLFQHHDGVTGTSTNEVMDDYGQKMFAAIKNCEQVISIASEFLLRKKIPENLYEHPELVMELDRSVFDALPEKQVVMREREIIVFNSLGIKRTEIVCVLVNSLNSVIIMPSQSNSSIPQQISPVIEFVDDQWNIRPGVYELCFLSMVAPLSFQKYLIKSGNPHIKATIRVTSPGLESNDFNIAPVGNLAYNNGKISVTFDSNTGHLTHVLLKERGNIPVSTSFVRYGARMKSPVPLKGMDNPPGAYLFLPDGPAQELVTEDTFVVIEGFIMNKVLIAKSGDVNFTHIIKLPFLSPSVEFENIVHLRNIQNVEIAMRLKTKIDSGDEFFTDLNGYQMIRRKRFKQLPIQAHFYPMSASAFIEDEALRMTLLTAQPLGVASLASGELEVMLDRRLNQDDGRGLSMGVTDNRKTIDTFRLLFETPDQIIPVDRKSRVTAYHSLEAYETMLTLLYPSVIMIGNQNNDRTTDYHLINSELPCDIHPVTVRTLAAATIYGAKSSRIHAPRDSYALILHRFGLDCRFTTELPESCNAKLIIKDVFAKKPSRVVQTSLTMLYEYSDHINEVSMEPMQVQTFRLDYNQ